MKIHSRFQQNLTRLPEIRIKKRVLSSLSFEKREPLFLSPKKNLSQLSKLSKVPITRLKILDILHSTRIQAKNESHQKLIEIQNRIKLIKSLQQKYKVQFTQSEIRSISNENLEIKAKLRYRKQMKLNAYNKIAYWWKRILIIKKIKADFKLVNSAANKIQTWWRFLLLKKSRKAEIKNLAFKILRSVVKIQAVFRGFLIRKSIGILLKKKKIIRNFEFFYEMKQKVMFQVLNDIVEKWCCYKVVDNYMKLYKKLKEVERKDILSLLKHKSVRKNVYNGIKEIITKHALPKYKQKMSSVPGSPLEYMKRQRSGTEDFILN